MANILNDFFPIINWPNFVYLLVDPGFLSTPPLLCMKHRASSTHKMDAPDRLNGQTDVSLCPFVWLSVSVLTRCSQCAYVDFSGCRRRGLIVQRRSGDAASESAVFQPYRLRQPRRSVDTFAVFLLYLVASKQQLLSQLWGDNYFILLTTVTTAMLEVYLFQQCKCNVCLLTSCCVWNYMPVEKTRSADNIWHKNFQICVF